MMQCSGSGENDKLWSLPFTKYGGAEVRDINLIDMVVSEHSAVQPKNTPRRDVLKLYIRVPIGTAEVKIRHNTGRRRPPPSTGEDTPPSMRIQKAQWDVQSDITKRRPSSQLKPDKRRPLQMGKYVSELAEEKRLLINIIKNSIVLTLKLKQT